VIVPWGRGVGPLDQGFWFRRTGFRFLPLASCIFRSNKFLAEWEKLFHVLRRLETTRHENQQSSCRVDSILLQKEGFAKACIAGGIPRLDAGDAVKKRNNLIAWKQQVNNRGGDEKYQDQQNFRLVHFSGGFGKP
jgi:hypothetical protein